MIDTVKAFWSAFPQETEFWSAIVGAIVGGLIAFAVQMISLKAAKKHRDEDHRRVQQALGNSLLFKMIRIHSDFYGIHRHIENCFENATANGLTGEPWQFVLPLANPPQPVQFASEEMGMLLAQKSNDVFNSVLSMDVIHNSLIDAIKLLNQERSALTSRLKHDSSEGALLSGVLDQNQMLAVRPKMIEVNSLIEHIRVRARKDFAESGDALDRLNTVLRHRLGLTYKLESKVTAKSFEPTN